MTPSDAVERDIQAIIERDLPEPHRLLGAHPHDGGVVVRAFRPDAASVVVRPEGGEAVELERRHPAGVFEGKVAGAELPLRYELDVSYGGGQTFTLRDVAGMLRSFAYVASAAELQLGSAAPEGWEEPTREAFLAGYFDAVDASLMPPGRAAVATLLSIFELEKAVYELRYELNNRPDWVRIPVASIARLLEEPLP